MARYKNADWNLPEKLVVWEQVNAALLMDIRDELQQLNRVLSCSNLTRYENILRDIRKKLPDRRKPRVKKK